jgi:hypothetical protein
MSADLRCACPLSSDDQFLGSHRLSGDMDADTVDFATHNHTPRHPREGDFCVVGFSLDRNPQTGRLALWRRRNPTIAPDPLSGGRREELADGVAGLRFEYSDGDDWYDTWGDVEGKGKAENSARSHPNLFGLPQAVRITLWLDVGNRTNEPPMTFQTVARLNLAPAVESNLAAGASSGQDSGPGNSNSSPGANPGANP